MRALGYDAVKVDRDAAPRAVGTLAKQLGRTCTQTAAAIIDVAVSGMYAGVSGVVSRYGIDPRSFSLLPFGGAGPMMACFIAQRTRHAGFRGADDARRAERARRPDRGPEERFRAHHLSGPGPRGAAATLLPPCANCARAANMAARRNKATDGRGDDRGLGGDALQGPVVRDRHATRRKLVHAPADRTHRRRLPRAARAGLRPRRSVRPPCRWSPCAWLPPDRRRSRRLAPIVAPTPLAGLVAQAGLAHGGWHRVPLYDRAASAPGPASPAPPSSRNPTAPPACCRASPPMSTRTATAYPRHELKGPPDDH